MDYETHGGFYIMCKVFESVRNCSIVCNSHFFISYKQLLLHLAALAPPV